MMKTRTHNTRGKGKGTDDSRPLKEIVVAKTNAVGGKGLLGEPKKKKCKGTGNHKGVNYVTDIVY